jgi:hypothetical protein
MFTGPLKRKSGSFYGIKGSESLSRNTDMLGLAAFRNYLQEFVDTF